MFINGLGTYLQVQLLLLITILITNGVLRKAELNLRIVSHGGGRDYASPTLHCRIGSHHLDWLSVFACARPLREQLTCQRNFWGMLGADSNQYTANVERNDTAAICFRDPTELKYVVRTESSDPGGGHSFQGTIKIAPEEDPSPSMQTRKTASLTKEEPS
jgi:hypothetical protein